MMAELLYEQTVTVVADYLGPAADRFLRRQLSFHLDKQPEHLASSDLPNLAEWVETALGLLTDDKKDAKMCAQRIHGLHT